MLLSKKRFEWLYIDDNGILLDNNKHDYCILLLYL